jgi:hypothetical protein
VKKNAKTVYWFSIDGCPFFFVGRNLQESFTTNTTLGGFLMPLTTTQRILSEDPVSTAEACEALTPIFGRPVDRTTIYRWCLRGIAGTRLEHTRVGGRIVTSRQALNRFIEARNH